MNFQMKLNGKGFLLCHVLFEFQIIDWTQTLLLENFSEISNNLRYRFESRIIKILLLF